MSQRRRLLKFLSLDNKESYENLVKKLKLKKFEEEENRGAILVEEEGVEEAEAVLE